VAATGKRLFTRFGCNGCHGAGSSVRAPQLEGIFGRPGPIQIPKPGTALEDIPATTIVKDTRYIHDAILLPEKEIAAGYKSIMPTFKNQITEEQVLQIVAYLKSMGATNERMPQRTDNTSNLTEADYRARVGFKPENLQKITSPASTAEPGQPSTYQPGSGGAVVPPPPPTSAPAPAGH
jgi:mono/diheme cytochrome c family protein